MYNTDLPRRPDLPTSAQLQPSMVAAVISACTILVSVALTAEYAIEGNRGWVWRNGGQRNMTTTLRTNNYIELKRLIEAGPDIRPADLAGATG